MALRNADLAILSARFGVARHGASRFGFCPWDVEGSGTDEPGEYVWKEDKPPTTLWTLQSLYSFCGEGPTAAFSDSPDPSSVDEEVQFTDESTPSQYVSFWYWDFGDGSYSYDQNPTHIYTEAGEYTVTLYVAGIRGSASTTGTHTVAAGPEASFTWEQVPEQLQVDFTDTSTPGGWDINSWSWDFGDMSGTSNEQNPSYVYAMAGDYTVTLVVTDENENEDTFQDTVSVEAI